MSFCDRHSPSSTIWSQPSGSEVLSSTGSNSALFWVKFLIPLQSSWNTSLSRNSPNSHQPGSPPSPTPILWTLFLLTPVNIFYFILFQHHSLAFLDLNLACLRAGLHLVHVYSVWPSTDCSFMYICWTAGLKQVYAWYPPGEDSKNTEYTRLPHIKVLVIFDETI